jgi:hypothetical protein
MSAKLVTPAAGTVLLGVVFSTSYAEVVSEKSSLSSIGSPAYGYTRPFLGDFLFASEVGLHGAQFSLLHRHRESTEADREPPSFNFLQSSSVSLAFAELSSDDEFRVSVASTDRLGTTAASNFSIPKTGERSNSPEESAQFLFSVTRREPSALTLALLALLILAMLVIGSSLLRLWR